MTDQFAERTATAATSGQQATERFREENRVLVETTPERVNLLAPKVIGAVLDIIREHKVTYDEYMPSNPG